METSTVRYLTDVARQPDRAPYTVPSHPAPIDLRLDANEGPPPPLEVIEALAYLDNEVLRRYPRAQELEAVLASKHGVEPQRVVATAGADGAIDRICRAFLGPGRELVLPVPTFEMLGRYADIAGARTVEIDWPSGPFPTNDVLAAVGPDTAMIAVVSPNNPTGAVAENADIVRLSEACPQALILVDAAYAEFAETDLTPEALTLPNVVVVRSFSKAWGLAGLRAGYAIAQTEAAQRLRAAGGPYDVCGVSIALTLARLRCDSDHIHDYINRVRRERDELAERIRALGGEPVPSQANFVFARVRSAVWWRDSLAGQGIGIRIFPDQPKLSSCIRITCPGDESSFSRVLKALSTSCRPEAILFDLDGVLADVSRSYRRAIVETADAFGVRVTLAEVAWAKASPDSNNDWVVTHRLVSARDVRVSLDEVTRRFESIYQGTSAQPGLWMTERLLPEVTWLERLRRRVRLGIVTGRPRSDAERFLRQAGVDALFDTVICGEDAPPKPDPRPVALALRRLGAERAWMVGDTPDDVRAARAAGVVPLGIVAPSDELSITSERLLSAGAARVLDTLDQLEELLP